MRAPADDNALRSRITQALLFGSAVVCGLALIGIYFMVPVWREMFVDFGAKLPWTTQLVFNGRFFFPLAGWLAIAGSYAVVYLRGIGAKWVLLGIGVTLVEVVLLLGVAIALFQPIFAMTSVSSK